VHAPRDNNLVWLSNRLPLSIPDDGSSRNVSFALNYISTCLLWNHKFIHYNIITIWWSHKQIFKRLIRRVSLVKQEMLTPPEHLSSSPAPSGVRVTRSLVLCVCLVDHCLSFSFWSLYCLFCFDLPISDYPFGIFKLFLYMRNMHASRTLNVCI
jgi:hypothetical protein